jgi:hypothetical protein
MCHDTKQAARVSGLMPGPGMVQNRHALTRASRGFQRSLIDECRMPVDYCAPFSPGRRRTTASRVAYIFHYDRRREVCRNDRRQYARCEKEI